MCWIRRLYDAKLLCSKIHEPWKLAFEIQVLSSDANGNYATGTITIFIGFSSEQNKHIREAVARESTLKMSNRGFNPNSGKNQWLLGEYGIILVIR